MEKREGLLHNVRKLNMITVGKPLVEVFIRHTWGSGDLIGYMFGKFISAVENFKALFEQRKMKGDFLFYFK